LEPILLNNRTFPVKAILFDFDGVIAESVDVKTQAFGDLFKDDYPQHVAQIVAFHVSNGGMSRYDKFRYFYSAIIREELGDAKLQELCRRFNQLVVGKVIEAPFVAGMKEFLDKYRGRIPMYVLSATPDAEIKEIVERRNLSGYFQGVFGAPRAKTEMIAMIMVQNGYKTQEMIFLGDSHNDLKAARQSGVRFAARVIKGKEDWAHDDKVETRFYDLKEFDEHIRACDGI
jgi:HAD superfamily hydrolase (TIGR01549 family)